MAVLDERRPRPDRAPFAGGAGQAAPPERRRRLSLTRSTGLGYVFLAPALVAFGVFSWFPIGRGIVLSFQSVNFATESVWVGVENYAALLRDSLFLVAWRNTAVFTALSLVVGFVVPLILAGVINEVRRGGHVFRAIAYLPVVLPPVVSLLLWKWFFDPDVGLANTILRAFGGEGLRWIYDPATAIPSLVLVDTWASFGSAMLIYCAALRGIAPGLYEAAELDGAGFVRKIVHITLPQMRYILLVTLLLHLIGNMQVFTEPYVLTGGGPNGATTTIALQIYDYAFRYNDYGAAAAASVVLGLVLAVATGLYLWATRRWSGNDN
ncbi:carbohydrate ABC transporter permease [Occultella aeris]|uniref:Lactose transport system permease protein LacF n=1 Tax=Occultella aeris TaxID=2761496 RepID=A0A7M4DGL0_9MICO|nr:sugar ABC transporter permease [Occultella aeris]VZO36053.1 Lactose transport system permease protein LacF [Occultella aeris]